MNETVLRVNGQQVPINPFVKQILFVLNAAFASTLSGVPDADAIDTVEVVAVRSDSGGYGPGEKVVCG